MEIPVKKESTDCRREKVERLLGHHTNRSSNRQASRRRLFFGLAYYLSLVINRSVELLLAGLIVLFLAVPVGLFLSLTNGFLGKPVFRKRAVVGKRGSKIFISSFAVDRPLVANLALFWYVIVGRLSLVGTTITDWEQRARGLEQAYIHAVTPGIFSLWYVRQAGKIAHEGAAAIEWEYVFKKNILFDILLLLRTIPAFFFQSSSKQPSDSLSLFGLEIKNSTMDAAITQLEEYMKTGQGETSTKTVAFVNPDCLNKIFADRDYFTILQQVDLLLPDGIGMTIAGNLLQTPLQENVNGTDMLPFLCEMAAAKGYSLFLLGGRPGVADAMAGRLDEQYGVNVAGTAHGYFDHEAESDIIRQQINESGANILLVAFGAPLQEKWINNNQHHLNPSVLMGVGGLFDFYSGRTQRAPRWLREIGLEWLYRMLQEPGRMWKRYVVGNPLFLYRVMKWKLYTATPARVPMTRSYQKT